MTAKRGFAVSAFGSTLAFCLVTSLAAPQAEGPALTVVTDRPEAMYSCGETATFRITLTDQGEPVAGAAVECLLTLDGGKVLKTTSLQSAATAVTVSGTLETPGVLQCLATCALEDKPIRSPWFRELEIRLRSNDVNAYPEDYRLRLGFMNPFEQRGNKIYSKQLSSKNHAER